MSTSLRYDNVEADAVSELCSLMFQAWEAEIVGEMVWHIRLAWICGILEEAARQRGVTLTCRRFPVAIPMSQEFLEVLDGSG